MDILYKDVYEEGEKYAKQIAEKIENFKKLIPSGYELNVKNDELVLFAPYNITTGWQAKKFGERSGNSTKIKDLTEMEFKEELQKIDLKIKEKEKQLGYEQKIKLLEVEQEIMQQNKSIEILITMPERTLQINADIARLNFLYKKKSILEAGYIRKIYEKSPTRKIESCAFPLYALEKFRKAREQKLFDRFELWINEPYIDNVTLIGLIETDEYWLGYIITEFCCENYSQDSKVEKKENKIQLTEEKLKVISTP